MYSDVGVAGATSLPVFLPSSLCRRHGAPLCPRSDSRMLQRCSTSQEEPRRAKKSQHIAKRPQNLLRAPGKFTDREEGMRRHFDSGASGITSFPDSFVSFGFTPFHRVHCLMIDMKVRSKQSATAQGILQDTLYLFVPRRRELTRSPAQRKEICPTGQCNCQEPLTSQATQRPFA